MKKYGIIIQILIMLFLLDATSIAQEVPESEKCTSKGGIFDEATKICTVATLYSIHIDYPLDLTERNSFIESVVDKFITDIRTRFQDGSYPLRYASEGNGGWWLKIWYEQYFFSNDILTIAFYVDTLMGYGHNLTTITTFTLDLKNSKQISFDDLFIPNNNSLSFISSLASATLIKQFVERGEYCWCMEGAAPRPENFTAFALTSEGLRLFFGEYQVTSFAGGIPEITIPFSQLKGVLKPEYTK